MAVYLLHFEEKLAHSQHYIGYAKDVAKRTKAHANGTSGARLMEVIHDKGIGFVVARVWPEGDRTLERKLKNRKNGPKLCPSCHRPPGLVVVAGGVA
jgi:predicted GIY-YIG superfamily endonuclease